MRIASPRPGAAARSWTSSPPPRRILSEADSYKVQFAVHDRLTANGEDRIAGWKAGLALPTQYEPLKLSGPIFAGIYQSGVRPSGAVFEKGWPIKAGIECEMVARMCEGRVTAGNSPYTAETIKPFVANLYCGAEVVENRYSDFSKVSGPGLIADDVLQAACIVGTEIKDWQTLDFAGLKGRSEFEGKEIGAGPGANVMGGALISLAWLANKLLANGKYLQGRRRHPDRLGASAGVPAGTGHRQDGVRRPGRIGDHDQLARGRRYRVVAERRGDRRRVGLAGRANHSKGEAVIGRSRLRVDPRIAELACRLARADAHRSEDDGRRTEQHGCH